MNKAEWQQMTDDRIEDAKVLLAAQRWSFAYYVAGYAVECALKACVLKYVEDTGIIFDDPKWLEGCRTHDIVKLVKQANLDPARQRDCNANLTFAGYWGVAKDWSEHSRYMNKVQKDAEQLFDAITNEPDGVLRWIKGHW